MHVVEELIEILGRKQILGEKYVHLQPENLEFLHSELKSAMPAGDSVG